jgi:4-oxalocrotonate tautomerase
MPIVVIEQSPRDIEKKRDLAERVTQAFVDAYTVAPDAVQIFIHEVDHENWAKAGKLMADK